MLHPGGATSGIVGDGHDYIPENDKAVDDEDGVEMVEPAAKRARTSSPELDPLAGLEVAAAKPPEIQNEGNKEESATMASAATEGREKEDEDGKDEEDGGISETWKDVASPVPVSRSAELEATQMQEVNDAEATQTQTQPQAAEATDEDLF